MGYKGGGVCKNMEPGKMAFILCKTVCIFTNTEVVKRRQNNIHPKWFFLPKESKTHIHWGWDLNPPGTAFQEDRLFLNCTAGRAQMYTALHQVLYNVGVG